MLTRFLRCHFALRFGRSAQCQCYELVELNVSIKRSLAEPFEWCSDVNQLPRLTPSFLTPLTSRARLRVGGAMKTRFGSTSRPS